MPPSPKRLASWVVPLVEATNPALDNAPAQNAVDALLAIGSAYSRVSMQTEGEILLWAKEAWDRCFNIPLANVVRSDALYEYARTLAPASEALADEWLALFSDRKDRWAAMGSDWASEIKTPQVAATAILIAARCCHRTNTGYVWWIDQVQRAWDLNHLELESTGPLDAPSEPEPPPCS